ncbi:LysR family transcriptional regulator [Marinitenerispora sediminis]|uniref:LysR family transcriptional regulator n=1 Tax=Marinitenerispora sediminis TaxID=1931232 RepID=A0A368T2G0_9ACTN|nr:LysR family transcriptional regulator [Marinitenerispora sediminis]RCV49037.1 LysR family transcriptional regulator [Marinitenerispora sediminis]RCV51799.1 LysR family transcriptional regulator [Marinitenerispora sediminis]RCV55417.1 LysR family transcriptional regulator [Marinitenerispora sediminis]
MELRQLRYLVVIAEEGNLGRAAARLYVSQPALSYALRSLEAELGVRLFDRHSGGVAATAAGRDVVAEARRTLRQAERVAVTAERHRRGQTGVLRVGFVASGAGELTTRARAEYARRHPGVAVEPKRFDWGQEAAALREGQADVAFVWLPADLTGLHAQVVHTEARVVGLPAGHRLAGRAGGVSVLEVNDEPLMWTERAPRGWVDWWAVNPRPDGSSPRWGPTNDNVEEMLERVAEGAAVCFAAASMARYYARPDLAWVTLTDVEPLRVALAWPDGAAGPLVRGFAEVVRELAADLRRPP